MTRTQALQARWALLAERERRLVRWTLALIALALLWWLALAPALHTLRSAPAAHAALDAQLQQMTTLRAQAEALKAQPRASRDDALRALGTSVRDGLGPNSQLVTNSGAEGASVLLRDTSPDKLAPWLMQARANARAVPREVHLTRAASSGAPSSATPVLSTSAAGRPLLSSPPGASSGAGGAAGDAARVRWEGTVLMNLPDAPR